MPCSAVGRPSPSRYGSSIAAVRFSTTPSWKNLTLPHASRPTVPLAAPLDELGELLLAPSRLPLERPAHAQAELARAGELLVGALPLGVDEGVLAGGDPEPVVVGLAGPDARDPLGVGGGGGAVEHEVHRLLLQRPERRAVRVALDPPAGGVGRRGGDRPPARARAS